MKSVRLDDSVRIEHVDPLDHVVPAAQWDASNFADPEVVERFRSLRFGMFIHFGLSRGQDLSWGVYETRKAPDTGTGPMPDEVWTAWPAEIVLENFDASEWDRIARQAGMKYIVVISKHHDGFHMWDTAYSEFKITNTPFGRDCLKELADACHADGMAFGIYYSQRDWHHPDYAPVDPCLLPGEARRPGRSHQRYIEYAFNEVKELCTRYGQVDIFWFDAIWWGGMFRPEDWDSERLTRMIRELQPGIIINNRASLPGDFDTPENRIGAFQNHRPWESCLCLGESWSWTPGPIKPLDEIIRNLVNCVTGDGNLLLSWGAMQDGAFDPAHTERLLEVGAWLREFGQTIYGTRGGPFPTGAWGGSTHRGGTVWLHILEWPRGQPILPALPVKLLSPKSLTGGAIALDQSLGDSRLYIPVHDRSKLDTVIELTLEGPF